MFWLMFLLVFLGVVLILLEVIVPHGISIIAGLLVIAGAVTMMYRSDPESGIMLMVLAIPIAAGSAWWVFRFGIKSMALEPPRADDAPDGPPLGEVAVVSQALRPTGTVLWKHQRYPARTLRPETETPVGAKVRVAGHDSIYVLVEAAEAGAAGEKAES